MASIWSFLPSEPFWESFFILFLMLRVGLALSSDLF
jgi:hypothetical protein